MEVTEKDGEIGRIERTRVVDHGFDLSDDDQQKPTESKGHMHISQHRIGSEYIAMY